MRRRPGHVPAGWRAALWASVGFALVAWAQPIHLGLQQLAGH